MKNPFLLNEQASVQRPKNLFRKLKLLLLLVVFVALSSCRPSEDTILLSGEWSLHLDPSGNPHNTAPLTLDYDLRVNLPGTLDDAGIGNPNEVEVKLEREVMLHLHRKVNYTGPAYYTRDVEIPQHWEGQHIQLQLERVIWESIVWVNGKKVGNRYSLSTPHLYDLTTYLTPGRNTITICIDNTKKFDLNPHDLAHAYTDHTQIIWNGILGDISLKASNKAHITSLDIYPDYKGKSVSGQVTLSGVAEAPKKLLVQVMDDNNRTEGTTTVALNGNNTRFRVALHDDIHPWNEFTPVLYHVVVSLLDKDDRVLDTQEDTFGFRDLQAKDGRFILNDEQIYLRGTLECCIFPLTGHPPTDTGSWKEMYRAAKDFGLNHLRFHSWCPPRAAFVAADRMGMYLQVELPNWSLNFGEDMASVDFLYQEADNILEAYGNHPSFVLMSLGNELQGDFGLLTGLINKMKNKDQRRLYTTTSFTFQRGHGLFPEKVDDFFITQYTEKGWVRGQGVFDEVPPHFNADYTHAMDHIPVPLITHEIGQYSVFPDMGEIDKYTGVLQPLNFKAVRNDLEQKGLLGLAEKYTAATGKFATLLYKEEIERALKTDGVDGFQLLDLHDFSGQGTALVGVLNAFWEPKGFVSGEEWRTFCSEVVPLLWFEKAVYTKREAFTAEIGVANYWRDFADTDLRWRILDGDGMPLKENTDRIERIPSGQTTRLGHLSLDLSVLPGPAKYTVEVDLPGTGYKNQWNFWLYEDDPDMPETDALVTGSLSDALSALEQGRSVLLSPPSEMIHGIEGKFVPVFWSPVHFPNQPGTMGLLIDPEHAALQHFPTDFHSDWQWWDLCKNSKTLVLDDLDVDPIVTVIDNFFRNQKMGNVFETQAGSGKLLFSAIDLLTDIENRPAARQLKYSLIKYMDGPEFDPVNHIATDDIKALFIRQTADGHE